MEKTTGAGNAVRPFDATARHLLREIAEGGEAAGSALCRSVVSERRDVVGKVSAARACGMEQQHPPVDANPMRYPAPSGRKGLIGRILQPIVVAVGLVHSH